MKPTQLPQANGRRRPAQAYHRRTLAYTRNFEDRFVMGTAVAEPALVKDEFACHPRVGAQAGMLLQPGVEPRLAAAPAGEGDVRVVSAALGREAGGLARPLDLGG